MKKNFYQVNCKIEQRSISAFKKILKQTPEKKKNDKTMEHLKALDANFKSLCKKINHLVLLANPTEPGIDKAKLKERIDLYLDTEMPAIIETYVSL